MSPSDDCFEENLARTIIAKTGAVPPVNVLELLKERAIVESDSIPGKVDAITYYLKTPGKRPIVVFNESAPPNADRFRFTVAHELGHVLIPWHTGDYIDVNDNFRQLTNLSDEQEANTFASELLLPSDWIRSFLNTDLLTQDPTEVVPEIAERSKTSLAASSLKLTKLLPAGYLMVRTDESGAITLSSSSPDTVSTRLYTNNYLPTNPFPFAAKHWTKRYGSQNTYHWWFIPPSLKADVASDSRAWRAIFTDILDDIAPNDKTRAQQRISGVVGSANSRAKSADPDVLYSALVQRFQSAANLPDGQLHKDLMEHPLFQSFLVQRIQELIQPPKKPRKSKPRED